MSDTLMNFDTLIGNKVEFKSKLHDLSRDKKRQREEGYWQIDDDRVVLSCDKGKYELKFDGQRLVELCNYRLKNGQDVKNIELRLTRAETRFQVAHLKKYNAEGNEFDGSISDIKKIEYREKLQKIGPKITYGKINLKKLGTIRYSFAGSRLLHLSMNVRHIRPEYIGLKKDGHLLWKENVLPLKKAASILLAFVLICGSGSFLFKGSGSHQVDADEKIMSLESSPSTGQDYSSVKKELLDLRQELQRNNAHLSSLQQENRKLKRARSVMEKNQDEELSIGKRASGGIAYYKRLDDAPVGANLYYNKRSREFVDINTVPKLYRNRFLGNSDLYEKVDPKKISN